MPEAFTQPVAPFLLAGRRPGVGVVAVEVDGHARVDVRTGAIRADERDARRRSVQTHDEVALMSLLIDAFDHAG